MYKAVIKIFPLLLLLFITTVKAQKNIDYFKIQLDTNIFLSLQEEKFNHAKHNIYTYEDSGVILAIDGLLSYYPLMPEKYLHRLFFINGNDSTELDTRGIYYTPTHKQGYELTEHTPKEVENKYKRYYLKMYTGTDGEPYLIIWDIARYGARRILEMDIVDYDLYNLDECFGFIKAGKK